MSVLTKPMLAAKLKAEDLSALRYPLLASPKLDGVRCVVQGGQALSRNLKPIPNKSLYAVLSMLPTGLDGELVIPGRPFCEVTSAVMGRDSDSKTVEYWVFDCFEPPTRPFRERAAKLAKLPVLYRDVAGAGGWVRVVPQLEVRCEADVLALEKRWLDEGYEGIILRAPEAPYKEGRSTVLEQGLLKLKRFTSSEARIMGFEEQLHNANEAKRDATGKLKRSSAKGGKSGKGTLGKFLAHDVNGRFPGVTLKIGTGEGLTDELRALVWAHRRSYIGRLVKYRYQEIGTKDAPRIPIFEGFRDARDT